MIDCNKDLNEDMKALLEERVDTIVADKKKWKGDKSFLTGRNLVLIDNDAQMLLDAAQIEKLEGRMWSGISDQGNEEGVILEIKMWNIFIL